MGRNLVTTLSKVCFSPNRFSRNTYLRRDDLYCTLAGSPVSVSKVTEPTVQNSNCCIFVFIYTEFHKNLTSNLVADARSVQRVLNNREISRPKKKKKLSFATLGFTDSPVNFGVSSVSAARVAGGAFSKAPKAMEVTVKSLHR